MSPKMAAIVAYILGENWTDPTIVNMIISTPDSVLAQHAGDCGFKDFIGAYSDLKNNWDRLLKAAELTEEEAEQANRLFTARVHK